VCVSAAVGLYIAIFRCIKSLAVSDNGEMAFSHYHRIALLRHTDEYRWELPLAVDTPQCVPLSALGTVLHQNKTSLDQDFSTLFLDFRQAYETRLLPTANWGEYFNANSLQSIGVVQHTGAPLSIQTGASSMPSILNWIRNRHGPHHTAFVLMILPAKIFPGVRFHAITVTCDGLWKKDGGFGFQETAYIDNRPVRYERRFPNVPEFENALMLFIMTKLSYTPGTLQAVTLSAHPQKSHGGSCFFRLFGKR